MADTGDLALFKEMFGSFELYLTTDLGEISQESEMHVPIDIQALLDLPFDDPEVQNESESAPFSPLPTPTGPENETETESVSDSRTILQLPTAMPSKPECDLPLALDTRIMPLEPEFIPFSDSHPMALALPETPLSSKTDCALDIQPIPLLPTVLTLPSEPESESKSSLDMHPISLLPNPTPLSSMPEVSAPIRHKSLSSEEIEQLCEWSQEKVGKQIDLKTVTSEEMIEYLKKIYAEAQPKMTNSRKRKFDDPNIATEYHKNTMRNARSAINRYFRENNIKMDISTRNIQFQEANDVLDGKIKSNLKAGLSLPTQHKAIIPISDIEAINKYLMSNKPVTLRYRTWFILSLQFVSRGLEFHPQLNLNSLKVCRDENNHEYIKLSHGVKEKQHQEGNETANEKRIYALENGDQQKCPVHNLKEFMSRCDPAAETLFCHINKLALEVLEICQTWYTAKPVSKQQFGSFMGDICRNAGIKARYTAHCLRATATQTLDDEGLETRHIMFMTGHVNEASVRSYSRGTTTQQKIKCLKYSPTCLLVLSLSLMTVLRKM